MNALADSPITHAELVTVLEGIRSRADFPKAINRLRLRTAVEIGVHRAAFSNTLLRDCPSLEQLLSIDVWLTPGSPGGCPRRHSGPAHMAAASSRLAVFGRRSVMIRADSISVAQMLSTDAEHRTDFIYIDADHRYEAVRRDLEAWWLRLADHPCAIFAGHDYRNRRRCHVKRAVDEFAATVGLRLFVTANSRFPSWILCRGVPAAIDTLAPTDSCLV